MARPAAQRDTGGMEGEAQAMINPWGQPVSSRQCRGRKAEGAYIPAMPSGNDAFAFEFRGRETLPASAGISQSMIEDR